MKAKKQIPVLNNYIIVTAGDRACVKYSTDARNALAEHALHILHPERYDLLAKSAQFLSLEDVIKLFNTFVKEEHKIKRIYTGFTTLFDVEETRRGE